MADADRRKGGTPRAANPLPPAAPRHVAPDATALIEQAKRLEQLNSWFEVALDNMARGLSMFSPDKRLIVCNAIYREIYELPAHLTQPGTHLIDIVSYHVLKERGRLNDDDRRQLLSWIDQHAANLAEGKGFSHTQKLKNGRTILATYQPLSDGGWVDIQEDVTEKRRSEERIEWLARHDPLTEAANRFHFCERLDKELKGLRPGERLAVHWMDLDRFKPVNDTHGHLVGDALLKAVAQRLRSTVRETDIVGRLGGDEFAVIQWGVEQPEQAEGLAKRLLGVLNAPYLIRDHRVTVGASIGVVLAPDHGTNAEELLRKADISLYRVKGAGRGAYEIYRPDARSSTAHRVLEADLRSAFEAGELELYYQPIVDLQSRRVTSCEALMRWRHCELGMIPPATFIPIAESTGLVVDLGQWALLQACMDASTWPERIKVTVNISGSQLSSGDLFGAVTSALDRSGLAPGRLELELTETVFLRDEGPIKETLGKLRALGVRLAVDDFGTAFASLSYLRNFSFDKIKIDRSFVRDISERRDCAAIVNAVAGLAKALDIGTVAEGVETAAQLAQVSQVGCNEVQGFYFSRPVPASDIGTALLECGERLKAE